jgi:hypothetical protein
MSFTHSARPHIRQLSDRPLRPSVEAESVDHAPVLSADARVEIGEVEGRPFSMARTSLVTVRLRATLRMTPSLDRFREARGGDWFLPALGHRDLDGLRERPASDALKVV